MHSQKRFSLFTCLLLIFLSFSTKITAQVCIDNPEFTTHLIGSGSTLDSLIALFPVDLDCDGDIDILSGSYYDEYLYLWENDGNQNYTKVELYSSIPGLRHIEVADMNQDGHLDILTTVGDDERIYLLLNDGMQHFSQVDFAGGDKPMEVVAKDLNMDGHLDILFSSFDEGYIGYYPNNGNGTYGTLIDIVSTNFIGASTIDVIDFDQDGDLDVLATAQTDNKITVFLNEPTMPFSQSIIIDNAAFEATSARAIDMDKDGDMDIIASIAGPNEVVWYENVGANFNKHLISNDAKDASYVRPIDIDGDGDMDVLATLLTVNKLALYINNGKQSFKEQVIDATLNNPLFTITADLDLDGDLDILASSPGDDAFSWYENTCTHCQDFEFIEKEIEGFIDFPTELATGDVDNDGDKDFIVSTSAEDKLYWYENVSLTNFSQHTIANSFLNNALVIDLNQDGFLDIVGSTRNPDYYIIWLENNATQDFTTHDITNALPGKNKSSRIIPFDLDRDGDLDLVLGHGQSSTSGVAWLENDGNQNFTFHSIKNGFSFGIAVEDFDKDGDTDLIRFAGSGADIIYLYQNDGSQNFTEIVLISTIDDPRYPIIKDMDQDGDWDIIGLSTGEDRIFWLENTGGLNFTDHTIVMNTTSSRNMAIEDFDKDGDWDLLSGGGSNDPLKWFQNNGSQSFSSHDISTSNRLGDIVLVDLDNNGMLDVVIADDFRDFIKWYPNDCDFICNTNNLTESRCPIPTDTYQAVAVYSEGVVEMEDSVVFKAENSITLGAGFHAKSGCDFLAKIEDCPLSNFVEPTDNQLSAKYKKNDPKKHFSTPTLQIAPNPTFGETTISYQLTEKNSVHLAVYSMQGAAVRNLLSGQIQAAGTQQISFYTDDLLPGIYVVGLRTGSGFLTQKMVVVE